MSDNKWCFLTIEPQRRLVWTNELDPGFRPNPQPKDENLGFFFGVDLRLSQHWYTKFIAKMNIDLK